MGDRDFVKDVARMNAAETDMSRLAIERSSSADVKTFAQMMVDDHTAAGAKLSGVAVQNSIEAPTDPDETHRSLRDKLAAKQGLDFDKDYLDAMVEGHEEFVDKLESRIDKETLSKWKGDAAYPTADARDKATMATVQAQAVTPEKSDDVITQRVNAWAAETYPTAYAHLQAARTLRDTVKKRSTD
jgi:putative membrane protein